MLYTLPFISAFIGWFTNWIAIKMLFHPRLEKNILGFKIQGIFPKRQAQFAEKLGQLVSKELISFDDIASKINSPQTLEKLVPTIELHVNQFINVKNGHYIDENGIEYDADGVFVQEHDQENG